jgi:tetratricopeptide (TPR) repeat protein
MVDARTDVYSLGVTLYELLTLEQAYTGEDRHVVLRKIERDEPIAPRRINPSVPADLETIVLTAMAKVRDERYSSAQALADDLGRFLAGEPALARRPGLVDRAAKWAKRHRSIVAIATAAAVLVSILSSVGMVLLAREQDRTISALAASDEHRRMADENFERAEANFLKARDMLDRLGVQTADRLMETPGTEPVRRQLLDDTLRYYRDFIKQASGDEKLRHELALAHFKSAVLEAKLGDSTQAAAAYRNAESVLEDLAANDVDNAELRSQLALTNNNLAILAASHRDFAEAQRRYERARGIQRQLATEHPDDSTYAAQLAETQSNLGMLLDSQGDAAGAEICLEESVELLRPLVAITDAPPRHVRILSIAANNLSYLLAKRDVAAAERASREAIEVLERLSTTPQGAQYQSDLALCYNNLAALLSRTDRASEAITWHGRAIALQEQMARKAPAVVRYRSDLAISLNNLGVAYCRNNDAEKAEVPFRRARDLFATLASDYPDELGYQSALAGLLNNQALALAGAGRHERAVGVFEEAIKAQQRCHERAPGAELMQEILSKMVYNQGQSLVVLGRWDESVDSALARRQIWRDDGRRLFGVAVELAATRGAMNRHGTDADELERADRETIATLRQAFDRGFRYSNGETLADDERFQHLRSSETFNDLIADLAR